MEAFSFGRYSGRSFEDVAKSDSGYCDWALRQPDPGRGLKDFVSFLRARASGGAGGGTPRIAAVGQAAPQRGSVGGLPREGRAPREARRPREGRRPREAREPREPRAHREARSIKAPSRKHVDVVLVCQLLSARKFVVRAECLKRRGRQVQVPPHVAHHLAVLEAAERLPDGMSWAFPLSLLDRVVELLQRTAIFHEVEPIPGWVLSLLHREGGGQPAAPASLVSEPDAILPYQREGVLFGLRHHGRCLIGDEMGLGKTLQGLTLAAQYPADWPVLVVCPATLRWVWKEQALEWFPHLLEEGDVQVLTSGSDKLDASAKLVVVSYNLLQSTQAFQRRAAGGYYQVVICDESHCCKDWDTKRTQAVIPLLQQAKRVTLLSGTPTRNNPAELHPQISGLMRDFCTFAEFKARYCTVENRYKKITGGRNKTELNALLTSTVMIRRLKKNVLQQLPPKRRQKVPLEPASEQVMQKIQQLMPGVTDMQAGGERVLKLFKLTAEVKLPAVREYLTEIVQSSREKFIVFAHHYFVLDSVEESLKQCLAPEECGYIRIDGQVAMAARADLVKEFQESARCRAAILSITACSEGISLTAASRVVFAELYWVPGVIEQAEARAHRIGTAHSAVVIDFLVVGGTADEAVYGSLQRKKKDTSSVLDGRACDFGAHERRFQKRSPTDGQQPRPGKNAKDAAHAADAVLPERPDEQQPRAGSVAEAARSVPGVSAEVRRSAPPEGPAGRCPEEAKQEEMSFTANEEIHGIDSDESSSDESSSSTASTPSSASSSALSAPLREIPAQPVQHVQKPEAALALPALEAPDGGAPIIASARPAEESTAGPGSRSPSSSAGAPVPAPSTAPAEESAAGPGSCSPSSSDGAPVPAPSTAPAEESTARHGSCSPSSSAGAPVLAPSAAPQVYQSEPTHEAATPKATAVVTACEGPEPSEDPLASPGARCGGKCARCGRLVAGAQEVFQCPGCRGKKRKHLEDDTCRKSRCQC